MYIIFINVPVYDSVRWPSSDGAVDSVTYIVYTYYLKKKKVITIIIRKLKCTSAAASRLIARGPSADSQRWRRRRWRRETVSPTTSTLISPAVASFVHRTCGARHRRDAPFGPSFRLQCARRRPYGDSAIVVAPPSGRTRARSHAAPIAAIPFRTNFQTSGRAGFPRTRDAVRIVC